MVSIRTILDFQGHFVRINFHMQTIRFTHTQECDRTISTCTGTNVRETANSRSGSEKENDIH